MKVIDLDLNIINLLSNNNMDTTVNSDPQDSSMDIGELFKDAYKGKIKDKYHFDKKLSSGGFGIVYLAEERKTK